MPKIENPADYVHVADDGAARELEPDEIEYLGTEFHGADSGRPAIMSSYDEVISGRRMGGYLLRERLPTGVQVRSIADATPVLTSDEAIRIAKGIGGFQLVQFLVFVTKSGRVGRISTASGQFVGDPGADATQGNWSASLSDGVWHVVRAPDASRADAEQTAFIDVSAASGRLMRFGRVPTQREPSPIARPIPGASDRRRPWWKFWA